MRCEVCFRHCELREGETGACRARACREGKIGPVFYGEVSSLALDPIEKKPLRHFLPGSMILSVGSLGCNLRCPFCQNHEIAQFTQERMVRTEHVAPGELAELAYSLRGRGNIGVAYTYNEPLVDYEYVRDTAKRVREKGMKNVLVSNGTAALPVLDAISPYMDAMNLDLKGFTDTCYDLLQGNRQMVMDFIREAVKRCHVELTTLIVPGVNDTEQEMRELSGWVAGLKDVCGGRSGEGGPLHVTRFFPRYHMMDRPPTDVALVYRLVQTARENLKYVYPGNC